MTKSGTVFATFAPRGGIGLYASQSALREIAEMLRSAKACTLMMDAAPSHLIEDSAVTDLVVRPPAVGPVSLSRAEDSVEIAGGVEARSMLASALEGLSELTARLAEPVQPHLDLEYFPGHGFLDAESMWMTVLLIHSPGH